MKVNIYNPFKPLSYQLKLKLVDFLYEHLQEYGDEKSAILKAVEYAMKERSAFGGFACIVSEGPEILGATILNKTGMDEYVPEYLLVYIATHSDHRGKGIGKKLMQEAIANTKGNIALHVEPENPAKHLYEKLGFEAKYVEMRLIK